MLCYHYLMAFAHVLVDPKPFGQKSYHYLTISFKAILSILLIEKFKKN